MSSGSINYSSFSDDAFNGIKAVCFGIQNNNSRSFAVI